MPNTLTIEELKLPINRPEYVAITELFFSALYWNVLGIKNSEGEEIYQWAGKEFPQLCYDTDQVNAINGWPKTIPLFKNAIDGTSERWIEGLLNAGFRFPPQNQISSQKWSSILAKSLEGTSGEGSKSKSVLPLTPALALSQNGTGVLRKTGPANIGQILDAIYLLGDSNSGEDRAKELASTRLHKATQLRLENDEFLNRLDSAVMAGIHSAWDSNEYKSNDGLEYFEKEPKKPWDDMTMHAGFSNSTPFRWFWESWNSITNSDWVEALPARKWLDWASTVLRSGFAFSLLWEQRWYEVIGRSICNENGYRLDQRPDTISEQDFLIYKVSEPVEGLIRWAPRHYGSGHADINSPLLKQIKIGTSIYTLLFGKDGYFKENPDLLKEPFHEVSESMAPTIKGDIFNSLYPTANTMTNNSMRESIRDTLRPRGETGRTVDHYSFFRAGKGRYWRIEPATEWIAVIASLACDKPGGTTTLGAVKERLNYLGLKPDNSELLHELEKAGLARGSADADEAIQVRSAF